MTPKTVRQWGLDDWVTGMWQLYAHHDEKRSLTDMWASTVIYTSNIAEGLRKADYSEVFQGIAHTFAWICSTVAKANNDSSLADAFRLESLSDIVAYKYPNKCPHCNANPCRCSSVEVGAQKDKKTQIEQRVRGRSEFQKASPYGDWPVDQWVGMFKQIYENSYMPLSVELIGFHLAEEVGEVSKALREFAHQEANLSTLGDEALRGLKYELESEVADCFSWLCSVFLRIKAMLEGAKPYMVSETPLSFSGVLAQRFTEEGASATSIRCPAITCKQDQSKGCRCPLQLVKYVPAPGQSGD